MNSVMNHAPGAGSITRPVGQKSNTIPLYHECLSQIKNEWCFRSPFCTVRLHWGLTRWIKSPYYNTAITENSIILSYIQAYSIEWVCMNWCLRPNSVVYSSTGLGTTCVNEMIFGKNHASGAGSITQPVDPQSSMLTLCYSCPCHYYHTARIENYINKSRL